MSKADNPEISIPGDLSAGMILNFLEELEEQLEAGALTPDFLSYALQLVQHLMTLTRDSLQHVEDMRDEVDKVKTMIPLAKLLLKHDISRYPMVNQKEATKVLDRLYRACTSKAPPPPPEQNLPKPGSRADSLGGVSTEEPFV